MQPDEKMTGDPTVAAGKRRTESKSTFVQTEVLLLAVGAVAQSGHSLLPRPIQLFGGGS